MNKRFFVFFILSILCAQAGAMDPSPCRKLLMGVVTRAYLTRWHSSTSLSNDQIVQILSAQLPTDPVVLSLGMYFKGDETLKRWVNLQGIASSFGIKMIQELSTQQAVLLDIEGKPSPVIAANLVFSGTAKSIEKFIQQLKPQPDNPITFRTVLVGQEANSVLTFKARSLSDLNIVPHISMDDFFAKTYYLIGPEGKIPQTLENPMVVIDRENVPVMVGLKPPYIELNEVSAIKNSIVKAANLGPEDIAPEVLEGLELFRSASKTKRGSELFFTLSAGIFKNPQFFKEEFQSEFLDHNKIGLLYHNEKYGEGSLFLVLIPIHPARAIREVEPPPTNPMASQDMKNLTDLLTGKISVYSKDSQKTLNHIRASFEDTSYREAALNLMRRSPALKTFISNQRAQIEGKTDHWRTMLLKVALALNGEGTLRPAKHSSLDLKESDRSLKEMLFEDYAPNERQYLLNNVDFIESAKQMIDKNSKDKRLIKGLSKVIGEFMRGNITPDALPTDNRVLVISDKKTKLRMLFMIGKRGRIIILSAGPSRQKS